MFKFQKLSDSSCSGEKPAGPTQRSCNAIICPAEWKPTVWSKVRDLDGEEKDSMGLRSPVFSRTV